MSSITSDLLVSPQDLYISSSTIGATLGTRGVTRDGRQFRYVYSGGVALVPGTLLQCKAETTAWENLTAVAASVGATSISASSTVTVTANQWSGGYAIITVTPGQGYMYQISSNLAYTAAAPTINLSDAIVVALTTSSRIDVVPSNYSEVIINPTTATGNPIGAAITATPVNNYGWIQTGGVTTLLADGAVTVGTSLVASNGTAGAVEALTGVQAIVGIAVTGIATTEYGAVDLLLD